MRILLFTAALLLLAGTAFGGPCLPGSLQDYLFLSAGCTVNSVLFQDFFLGEIASFSTEIDPLTIQVTPGGSPSGAFFLFTLNRTAGPGEVLESSIHFDATGALAGASIRLGNPVVAGDGAVTGVLDVCADGFFLGVEPVGCNGNPGAAIAFATDFDTQPVDSLRFATSSFFDVFVDLTIDGGLGGFAGLDTAEAAVLIPEPSALLLIAGGLVTITLAGKCRKQHSR